MNRRKGNLLFISYPKHISPASVSLLHDKSQESLPNHSCSKFCIPSTTASGAPGSGEGRGQIQFFCFCFGFCFSSFFFLIGDIAQFCLIGTVLSMKATCHMAGVVCVRKLKLRGAKHHIGKQDVNLNSPPLPILFSNPCSFYCKRQVQSLLQLLASHSLSLDFPTCLKGHHHPASQRRAG